MALLWDGLVIVASVEGIALIGSILAHRYVPALRLREVREAADPVWAIAGAVFGILLGFMAVIPWQDVQDAQAVVQDEADDLVDLYQLALGLPEDERDPLREQLVRYARLVVDDERQLLSKHIAAVSRPPPRWMSCGAAMRPWRLV